MRVFACITLLKLAWDLIDISHFDFISQIITISLNIIFLNTMSWLHSTEKCFSVAVSMYPVILLIV
jgi:hypothetical protein